MARSKMVGFEVRPRTPFSTRAASAPERRSPRRRSSYQMLWPRSWAWCRRVRGLLAIPVPLYLLSTYSLLTFLDLDRGDLRHPAGVATTLEWRLQPHLDDRNRLRLGQMLGAQAEDVGVVVAARLPRPGEIPDVHRAHAVDLVGGDAHPEAGPAHQQTEGSRVIAHGAPDGRGGGGIVARLGGRRAELLDLDPPAAQVRDQATAQREPRMVTAG